MNNDESRSCTRCGAVLHVGENWTKGRHACRKYICTQCARDASCDWRAANPEAQRTRYRTPEGRAVALWLKARKRAVKDGLSFTITREWVAERLSRGVCEATGARLFMGRGTRRVSAKAPTVDQVIPGKGYTPENAMVTCWAWNRAKSDSTQTATLRMFAVAIAHYGTQSGDAEAAAITRQALRAVERLTRESEAEQVAQAA